LLILEKKSHDNPSSIPLPVHQGCGVVEFTTYGAARRVPAQNFWAGDVTVSPTPKLGWIVDPLVTLWLYQKIS